MELKLETAGDAARERERLVAEGRRLDAERQAIEDESTSVRLEKNRLARIENMQQLVAVGRFERVSLPLPSRPVKKWNWSSRSNRHSVPRTISSSQNVVAPSPSDIAAWMPATG